MAKSQHHTSLTTERQVQSFLFPHVCFSCRKSFKKPYSEQSRRCPQCKGALVRLSRKFKSPKNGDTQAWMVVEFLVKAGFHYESIYISGGQLARYPKTLKEAEEFVRHYAERIKQSVS